MAETPSLIEKTRQTIYPTIKRHVTKFWTQEASVVVRTHVTPKVERKDTVNFSLERKHRLVNDRETFLRLLS